MQWNRRKHHKLYNIFEFFSKLSIYCPDSWVLQWSVPKVFYCRSCKSILYCFSLIHTLLELVVSPSSIAVSEGSTAHFCVSLNGNLRATANVSIQTRDTNATGMHTEKEIFSINDTYYYHYNYTL